MNQKLISLNAVKTALVRLAGLSLLAFSVSVVAAPPVPTLSTPYSGATNVAQAIYNGIYGVNFTWNVSGSSPTYRIVISQNPEFSGFVDSNGSSSCKDNTCFTATTSLTNYTKSLSCSKHTYYWKVRSNDKTGASGFQYPARSFTTSGSVDSCPAILPDFIDRMPLRTFSGGWCKPQCVDFVKYNLGLTEGGRDAKDFWTRPHPGYTNYPQGSSKAPKPGDIMVWGASQSNSYGHVAIVKSVNLNTGTLIRVDTNWSKNIQTDCQRRVTTMSITKNSSGGYVIGGRDSTSLLGWQSKS
ncbi:MAG: CHAP domain-containing protein [Methylococcaceae bacterium]